jgi:threonine dehydrogenase-like Zn-dependent dehydrogenase
MFERAGGFKPGHYANVFGAGPIGLTQATGEDLVAAFEVSEVRKRLAAEMRADFVYDPREVNADKVLMELSKGEGFNFHVEVAGVPHIVIPEMKKALAMNSKVVQTDAQGHSGHETFPSVIRMVAAGRLNLSPIVTARYGLEATKEAIAKSMKRTDGKILVKPT